MPGRRRYVYHAGSIAESVKEGKDLTVEQAGKALSWNYATEQTLRHIEEHLRAFGHEVELETWHDFFTKTSLNWADVTGEYSSYPNGNYVEEELAKRGIVFRSVREMERSISVLWVESRIEDSESWTHHGPVIRIDMRKLPDLITKLKDPILWGGAYILVLWHREGNIPANAWRFV